MRKLVKILGWIAGVVVVLILLLAIGIKLFFPVEKAKALAVERGSRMLGRSISVEDVSVSFWGGLGVLLGNVAIAGPPEMDTAGLLAADAIDLKLKLWPLLSGMYRVDRLVIDRPRISLVKTADGRNNYTFAFPEPAEPVIPSDQLTPETKAAATAVSFERFEINDGRLVFVDDSARLRIEVTGFDLSTSVTNPRPGDYESSGKIDADSVIIRTEEPLRPLRCRLRYHAAYNLDEGRLTVEEVELKANDLVLSADGELTHSDSALAARANIKTRTIPIADFLSVLPDDLQNKIRDYSVSGDISLQASLEYDVSLPDTLQYSGTAVISDAAMSHKKLPGKLELERVSIDFEPGNARVNLERGTFDGQPLQGHLVVDDFDDPQINGALSGRCDLGYLAPFIPTKRTHQITGQADFDVKLSGRISEPQSLGFSGSLVVTAASYQSELLPEPIETLSCDLFFDNKVTRINRAAVTIPSGHLNLSGRIDNLAPYLLADTAQAREVRLSTDGHLDGKLKLSLLAALLPPTGNPRLSGSVAFDLDVTGDMADLQSVRSRGEMAISQAAYSDDRLPEPVRSFEASFRMTEDTLTIERMTARFESSDISISGRLIRPLPYLLPLESIDRSKLKKPLFLFEVLSHRFDTDRLFPEAVPGSGANRATLPTDSLPPIILPDIDGQGSVQFDTVIYSRIEFTNLRGRAKIHDRKLTLEDLTGNVYTGDVAGQTTIDLNEFENPLYTGEFQATRIELDDFVTRFTKFGGSLFGKTDLTGSYAARGWEPEEFQNTLTMNGNLAVGEGKLVTSGLLHSAVAGLANLAGHELGREQALKNLSTAIAVQDGRVKLDRLKTRLGDIGDLELDGFFALDYSGLEYKGTLLLSKEWTKDLLAQSGLLGGLAGLFGDSSVDRLKVPLTISGTVDNPQVDLDYSAMGGNVKDNLSKEAGNLLKDLFKKK